MKKTSPTTEKAIASAYSDGVTINDLVRQFKLHRSTIRAVVRRGGGVIRERFRSPEEDDAFRARWERDESLQSLADLYDITASAVRAWAKHLGLPQRYRSPRSLDERIRSRYAKNFSLGRIAQELEVATGTVAQTLKRLGLRERLHPDRLSGEQIEEAIKKYEAGVPSGVIAKDLGVTTATIRTYARKAGLLIKGRGNKNREFTEDEYALLQRMCAAGESQQAIAKMLKTQQTTVSNLIKQRGLTPRFKQGGKGAEHGSWKGGRVRNREGYIRIRLPAEDPLACMLDKSGYVLEHRLVVARRLGRPLETSETIHHINGDKTDNRDDNLELRTGGHGAGVAFRCRSCGSHDVEPVPLKVKK